MRILKLSKYRDPWPGVRSNIQMISSNKWYQPYLTRPKWRMMKAQRHYQESWLLLKAHVIFSSIFCFNFKLNKIGVFPAAPQIHYMYWTRFQYKVLLAFCEYYMRAFLWVPYWTNLRLIKVILVASTLTYLPSLEVPSSKLCDLYQAILSY